MTHDEARLLIGAAPAQVSAPLAEHLAACSECTLFQAQMRRMDQDLGQLFAATPFIADSPRASARVIARPIMPPAQPKAVRRGLPALSALAASLIFSVGLGLMFWTLRPAPSLAADVVDHVTQEPASWSAVVPMGAQAAAPVLAGAGGTLDPADPALTYARICLFNGHWVPHLVVRTAVGPITVLVLREEHITARQWFRQNGYSGMLVPAEGGGALAVLAQGDADLDAVAQALGAHLHPAP